MTTPTPNIMAPSIQPVIPVVDDFEYTPIWDTVKADLDVILTDLDVLFKQAQGIIL